MYLSNPLLLFYLRSLFMAPNCTQGIELFRHLVLHTTRSEDQSDCLSQLMYYFVFEFLRKIIMIINQDILNANISSEKVFFDNLKNLIWRIGQKKGKTKSLIICSFTKQRKKARSVILQPKLYRSVLNRSSKRKDTHTSTVRVFFNQPCCGECVT